MTLSWFGGCVGISLQLPNQIVSLKVRQLELVIFMELEN